MTIARVSVVKSFACLIGPFLASVILARIAHGSRIWSLEYLLSLKNTPHSPYFSLPVIFIVFVVCLCIFVNLIIRNRRLFYIEEGGLFYYSDYLIDLDDINKSSIEIVGKFPKRVIFSDKNGKIFNISTLYCKQSADEIVSNLMAVLNQNDSELRWHRKLK